MEHTKHVDAVGSVSVEHDMGEATNHSSPDVVVANDRRSAPGKELQTLEQLVQGVREASAQALLDRLVVPPCLTDIKDGLPAEAELGHLRPHLRPHSLPPTTVGGVRIEIGKGFVQQPAFLIGGLVHRLAEVAAKGLLEDLGTGPMLDLAEPLDHVEQLFRKCDRDLANRHERLFGMTASYSASEWFLPERPRWWPDDGPDAPIGGHSGLASWLARWRAGDRVLANRS